MNRVTNVEIASTKVQDHDAVIWNMLKKIKKKQNTCSKMTVDMIEKEMHEEEKEKGADSYERLKVRHVERAKKRGINQTKRKYSKRNK